MDGRKGRPRRNGHGKKYAIRMLVTAMCVGTLVAFTAPGRSLQAAIATSVASPQPGSIPSQPVWSEYVKTGREPGYSLSGERPDLAEQKDLPYDYSKPVPQTDAKDNDYFADAVFVGDSRTDGLLIYSGVTGPTNLSYKGMTVDEAQDKPVLFTGRTKKTTAISALGERQYGKVYVMLGVNELGWTGTDKYENGYRSLLAKIRELQPDAVIYIQSTLPVAPSATEKKDYINNEHIQEYNEVVRRLAEEFQMYYLDVAECVRNEQGALPEEASVDGVHLTRAYYRTWLEYLKCHTVEEK